MDAAYCLYQTFSSEANPQLHAYREKHSDVSEVLEMPQSSAALLKHASAPCSWFAPSARLPVCLSGTHASAKST